MTLFLVFVFRFFHFSLSLVALRNSKNFISKTFSSKTFSLSLSLSSSPSQSHRQRVLPPLGQRPLRRLPLPGGRRPRPGLHPKQLLLGRQRPAGDVDRRRHVPRAVAPLPAAVGLRGGRRGALLTQGQGRGRFRADAGGDCGFGVPGGRLRGQDQGATSRGSFSPSSSSETEVERSRPATTGGKNLNTSSSAPPPFPLDLE